MLSVYVCIVKLKSIVLLIRECFTLVLMLTNCAQSIRSILVPVYDI